MRPVGAFIFGFVLWGDRFGRRIPLMIDIIFYSAMELLTAFSPSYTWLLIFRALYGIGMGGEWGWAHPWRWKLCRLPRVDCSLEFCNRATRSVTLLAAVVTGPCFHSSAGAGCSWRECCRRSWLFSSGRAFRNRQHGCVGAPRRSDFWKKRAHRFATALGSFSLRDPVDDGIQRHVTRHPGHYQTFLGEQRHYGVTQKAATGIIYAFGAICGWNDCRSSLAKNGAGVARSFLQRCPGSS